MADFAEDLRSFALGTGLFVLGVLICLSVIGRFGSAWFFFGAFAACMGLMKVAGAWAVFPMALPFPRLILVAQDLTIWLAPAALGGFSAQLFRGALAPWLRRVGWLAALSSAALLTLELLDLTSARLLRPAAELVVVVTLGLVLATVLPLARRGDRRARLVVWGVAAQVVSAVPELLHGLHIGTFSTGYLGTLALIGCLALALRREYADKNEHLMQLTDALEARVAELDARHREVATLNAELRYQVGERSRELARLLSTSLEAKGPVVAVASLEGTILGGRYRLGRALGKGAMGSVFAAERVSDGARVAIKVLHSLRDEADAVRFSREAEIAAHASHPNLVAVLDVGMTATGSPFLVMEHVEGGTLADEVGRLGLVASLCYLSDVAKALRALHAAGVVHRDLKPANVLLEKRGETQVARLSDFGISRREDLVADEHANTFRKAERLTRTGAFLGTPLYMAPEQATQAARVEPSADIFSFGVMAYELLTGQPPFMPPAVFRVLAHAPIPAPELKLARLEGMSAAVGAALDACLSLDPAARPEAGTLVEVLSGTELRSAAQSAHGLSR
ncbi:MAG: serine/threonine-protein kinase [Myxococcota bacterium]